MIDVKQLKFFAELKSVKFMQHTPYHCQLRGKYDVNVYPTTDRIYIKGMNHSARVFDHVEAVDYATGEKFPAGVTIPNRKPMAGKKTWLWERSKVCGICGEKIETMRESTVDHVVPLSKGGSNRMDNLQLAHEACNLKKGNAV